MEIPGACSVTVVIRFNLAEERSPFAAGFAVLKEEVRTVFVTEVTAV
jgi:hypothetical protein